MSNVNKNFASLEKIHFHTPFLALSIRKMHIQKPLKLSAFFSPLLAADTSTDIASRPPKNTMRSIFASTIALRLTDLNLISIWV